MSQTYYFNLPGITCINCVLPIEQALNACTTVKIESFKVDVIEKRMTILVANDFLYTEAEIRELLRHEIENIGITCLDRDPESFLIKPDAQGSLINPDKSLNKFPHTIIVSHLIQGIFGIACGIGLLMLSIWGMGGLPLIGLYTIVGISSLLTLILGAEAYVEAVKKLVKTKTLTLDALFTISTLTVVAVSIASIFYPWLPMMFEAGLLIFGFRHLGKAIEESLKQKTVSGLNFRERTMLEVEVYKQGIVRKCLVSQLLPNNVIIVRKGEVIPIDGECLDEASSLYDTIVTGANLPRRIKRGEMILAGMKVADDVDWMQIKVTRQASDSYLARLDNKIMQANMEKAPIETVANKLLQYFIPTVLILAIATGIIIGILFNPALAIQCAVAVLVSACPCTLGFITPLAVKIGMAKAVEQGVHFKSSKVLQAAEQIDTVVFDLNGTLTKGVPEVITCEITLENLLPSHELYACMALLESESSHPIAKAIFNYAQCRKTIDHPELQLTELDKSNHSGLRAKINGEIFVIGNKKMMADHNIAVDHLQDKLQQAGHGIYLARGNKVIAYLLVRDPIRSEAKQAIAELRQMGKAIHICTGADQETAQYYAKKLDIPLHHVQANCIALADNSNNIAKTHYIEQLKQRGNKVAMVGDAANDALAIAKSDLGIAVKSKASDAMTQQQASVVIHNTSLMPVVTALAVAKQTVENIKQNLAISLLYNIAMILLAGGLLLSIGIALNPGIGAALMVLQTSMVLLNAYRFKQQELLHLKRQAMPKEIASTYGILITGMPCGSEPTAIATLPASTYISSPLVLFPKGQARLQQVTENIRQTQKVLSF